MPKETKTRRVPFSLLLSAKEKKRAALAAMTANGSSLNEWIRGAMEMRLVSEGAKP